MAEADARKLAGDSNIYGKKISRQVGQAR